MQVNTKGKALFGALLTLSLVGGLAPLSASAQDRRDRDWDHRDQRDYRDRDRDRDYRDHDNYSGWSESQRRDWLSRHRRESKNEWRNIAIGAGALGALGFITHENFLGFAGTAGALYSLNRYEQDRRSEAREDRLRATYFGRPYFYRDGVRYERRLVHRNGDTYYQFVRR